jgi:hypothetical protein
MKEVRDAKELGLAIKSGVFPIAVKNEMLVTCVMNIRKPGKIVWVGVGASIVGMLLPITPFTIGIGLISWPLIVGSGAVFGGIALSTLGMTATVAAVNIAWFGGGIGALNTLRSRKTSLDENGNPLPDDAKEMIIY